MRIKLGTPMRLNQIAYACSGQNNNVNNPLVSYISTDTRELFCGDLFIAINGEKYNGNDFVNTAKSKGAFVVSSLPTSDIIHPDGRSALLSLAHFYNKNLPIILYRIGITGSVGKTTTKEFLKLLIDGSYKVQASEGNYNNEIGLPMSILTAEKDCQILLMEMGMNHPGEISRMSKCLCPSLALITCIGSAHIGNLRSRESIAKAKLEIMDGMTDGVVILPDDEPLFKSIPSAQYFSTTDCSKDFALISDESGSVKLFMNNAFYTEASFNFPQPHHIKCLSAAVSLAMKIGISAKELSDRIPLISNDNIRQRVFYRENYHFIADFYNASRESVLAFIESCRRMVLKNKKHLLLGDILELGDMSCDIHYEIGRNISPDTFDSLILFGQEIMYVMSGAIDSGFPAEKIFIISDLSKPEECANLIHKICEHGDYIFMKASRNIRLERVIECFKE